jgi:hypothetical protein
LRSFLWQPPSESASTCFKCRFTSSGIAPNRLPAPTRELSCSHKRLKLNDRSRMLVAACPTMNPWKRFRNEFKALMEEEDRIVRQRELGDRFYALVLYRESGEFGSWSFAGSATESLQARFELLATEAGIALSSPPGTLPHVYWLHCLFEDLRANNSPHIRINTDAGAFIEKLFEASATFCARLDRRYLEKSVMSKVRGDSLGSRILPPERAGEGVPPCRVARIKPANNIAGSQPYPSSLGRQSRLRQRCYFITFGLAA